MDIILDRIFWTLAIVVLTSLCSYMVSTSFLNWKKDPVILGLSRETISISQIPFPAVTICPAIKTRASEFTYTDVYQAIFKLDGNQSRVLTDKESKIMKVAHQICHDGFARYVWNHFPDNYSDDDIVKQIVDLAPKLEDTLVLCKFRNLRKNCNEFFTPTITEEGICYSFNALNSNEIISDETTRDFGEQEFVPSSNWNVEDGYSKLENVDTESYPYRVFGSGPSLSLMVILRVPLPDMDHLCSDPIQGFRIKFHNPGDDPQMWKKSYQLSPSSSKLFYVSPIGIKAMDEIRKYDPEIRQCFYRTERPLRYFKNYGLRNCEVECLANLTLERCGCVKFSMPRSNETQICGSAKMFCILQTMTDLFQSKFYDGCQCLSSCSWLDYDVKEFQAPYHLANTLSRTRYKNSFKLHGATFSRFEAFFEEDEEVLVPFVRIESQNLISLLSKSGGLFGLFMGASLFSFIELIYYLYVRVPLVLNTQ